MPQASRRCSKQSNPILSALLLATARGQLVGGVHGPTPTTCGVPRGLTCRGSLTTSPRSSRITDRGPPIVARAQVAFHRGACPGSLAGRRSWGRRYGGLGAAAAWLWGGHERDHSGMVTASELIAAHVWIVVLLTGGGLPCDGPDPGSREGACSHWGRAMWSVRLVIASCYSDDSSNDRKAWRRNDDGPC